MALTWRGFSPVDKSTAWADSGLPGQWGVGVFGRVRLTKAPMCLWTRCWRCCPGFRRSRPSLPVWPSPSTRPTRQNCRRIDAAGLSQRLVFLGEVPAGEVQRWYQRCLITVACPRYEPFGLACPNPPPGVPWCARAPVPSELYSSPNTGWLNTTGDAPAQAALERLMAKPEAAMAMGERALEQVLQRFSLQAGPTVLRRCTRACGLRPAPRQGPRSARAQGSSTCRCSGRSVWHWVSTTGVAAGPPVVAPQAGRRAPHRARLRTCGGRATGALYPAPCPWGGPTPRCCVCGCMRSRLGETRAAAVWLPLLRERLPGVRILLTSTATGWTRPAPCATRRCANLAALGRAGCGPRLCAALSAQRGCADGNRGLG